MICKPFFNDMYHRLVFIKQRHPSKEKRHHASILLSQYNTAGGPDIMRHEISNFLNQSEKFKPTKEKFL